MGAIREWNSSEETQKTEMSSEGCNLAGILLLPRAPGQFQISAHGKLDDVMAYLPGRILSVQHVVHDLLCSDPSTDGPPTVVLVPFPKAPQPRRDYGDSYQYYLNAVPVLEGNDSAVHYHVVIQCNAHTTWMGHMPAVRFHYAISSVAIHNTRQTRPLRHLIASVAAVGGGGVALARATNSLLFILGRRLRTRRTAASSGQ
eukprot:NODE_3853_length_722_cov_87.023774_g3250_i0.p1 GENE.NODE_3853_length_722_cov_87.023774_g3250_i0~~NODE_3853_length_722_cov_87.023774_g3250_i0.p1  ORF type:complete len:210 (-),score=37.51 NODE_3853_length_722_cov_87.023774_g3250_i0:93-695(-)